MFWLVVTLLKMSSFRRSTQKESSFLSPSEWIIVSKNELELLTSSQQEESRSFSVLTSSQVRAELARLQLSRHADQRVMLTSSQVRATCSLIDALLTSSQREGTISSPLYARYPLSDTLISVSYSACHTQRVVLSVSLPCRTSKLSKCRQYYSSGRGNREPDVLQFFLLGTSRWTRSWSLVDRT